MMNSLSFPVLLCVVSLGVGAQTPPVLPQKGITQEIWEHVQGNTLDKLIQSGKYKQGNASSARIVNTLDAGELGDQYGSRYSAFLTPPETGEYTFWLAADDVAELSLSPNDSAGDLKTIAALDSYTSPRAFGRRGKSSPVLLEKGKKYYLQVLHKEGSGGDHLSVSWEGPGVKKGLLTDQYTTPAMSGKTKQILEKTAADDARSRALFTEMLGQKPQDVPMFLDKMASGDLALLTYALKDMLKTGADLPKPERRATWEPFARLASSIMATPDSPVKNPAAKALLALESAWLELLTPQELRKAGPHRLASSLGTLPAQPAPVRLTTRLDSKADKQRSELVSTGTYALPGVPFTITVPEGLEKQELTVQVGHHIAPGDKAELVSLPHTTLTFPLKERRQTFVSPHGGIILLNIPARTGLTQTPLVFDQVLAAPRFVLGQTSDAEWKKIRNNPAPWGELISEHLILLLPAEQLRQLDNPTEVMAWWNENNRRHEDFYGYYPGLAFRMHASLYAREGVSYWPLEWQVKNSASLVDIDRLKKHNDALYLHEHGHHADFGPMEFGYSSESTCNWAGYYMKSQTPFDWKDAPNVHLLKLLNPEDKAHNEIKQPGWYSISTKGTHHWSYPITSLVLGYTGDFGWEPFKKTVHRLRDHKDPMYSWPFTGKKQDDQAKIDRYLIGLSEGAGRDVRPYFAHFHMVPSAGASAYLDKLGLPKWDLAHLPTPGVTETAAGVPLTIPAPQKTLLSMAGPVNITWKQPEHGQVVPDAEGNLIYTPKAAFTGQDKIPYTLTNPVGTSPTKYLLITVRPSS